MHTSEKRWSAHSARSGRSGSPGSVGPPQPPLSCACSLTVDPSCQKRHVNVRTVARSTPLSRCKCAGAQCQHEIGPGPPARGGLRAPWQRAGEGGALSAAWPGQRTGGLTRTPSGRRRFRRRASRFAPARPGGGSRAGSSPARSSPSLSLPSLPLEVRPLLPDFLGTSFPRKIRTN